MAFELPTLPFPIDARNTPYIASPDANGKYTVASGQWFKNASNLWVPVSVVDPLPIIEAELRARVGEVQATPTANTILARLKNLEDKIDGILDGSTPASTELTGSYVGYSTDAKPTITGYTPGTEITFLELDTGNVYVYDGTDWVVLA